MARLGQDRGRRLRVRQTNVDNGEIFVVNEADFIEGAYDPDHFEIVSTDDLSLVPETDDAGNVRADENGAPILRREYAPFPDKDRERVVRASAAERKDANAEARRLNPNAGKQDG